MDADVWVTILPGTPYQTCHIFECKNWKEAVGVEVVDRLQTKRGRLKAATATIVGQSFTAPARAAARIFDITLLRASPEFIPPIEISAPILSKQPIHQQAQIYFTHANATAPVSYPPQTEFTWNGKAARLSDVLAGPIERHLQSLPANDPRFRLEGRHGCSTSFGVEFDPGELLVAGREVKQIGLKIDYVAELIIPTRTICIGVEGRGGLIQLTYPPGTAGHESVVLQILTKPFSLK